MIDNEELFKKTIACQTLNNSNKLNKYHKIQKRFQESYYLRNIVGNLEFYREELNVLPNSLSGDKLIYQEIQEIVRTFEKAKVKNNYSNYVNNKSSADDENPLIFHKYISNFNSNLSI